MSAPSVHLCDGDGQFSYLVVHIEGMSTCYAYTIDKKTGGIYYGGIPDVDLFSSAKAAISRISDNVGHDKWSYLGKYLIGASIFENQLIILYVVSDEITAAIDDNPIKMIKTTGNVIIPINGAQQNSSPLILDFPLDYNHFFSNHIDLSLPFPYTDETKSTTSFFWNNRWTNIFNKIGTPKACVRIFQGAALSLSTDKGVENNITYIIRRSSLNSSTRYEARGLDKNCNTANECECDLIFTCKGENIGHTWIRGSAPVEWKTVLSSTISAPQHIVSDNPTVNTHKYFQKIMKRHQTKNISIVSLLNEAPEKGETDLLNAYKMGVDESNKKIKDAHITFTQININKIISKFKENGRIELFRILSKLVGEVSFTSNKTKQSNYMRFNCADSLDRTNLVSFYYAIIVVTQFCVKNGIFIHEITEEEDQNDLVKMLSSDVLDFLCNAFIQTGNIISFIYTNTPAIKTEAIRKLMTESSSQSSDIAITLLRRYYNVASDPYRHQIILKWNEVSDKTPSFYLDSIHLSTSFVPMNYKLQLIDHAILEEEERMFVLDSNTSKNLVIALPEPLLLSKVTLMLYPRTTVNSATITISCGNYATEMYPFIIDLPLPYFDKPQLCEFNLREIARSSSHIPVSMHALEPALFVNIRFNTIDESITIGNIKIAVKLPKDKKVAAIDTSPSRAVLQNFREFISDKCAKTLYDLCEIDKWCLKEHLSRQERNEELIKNQKNPFFYDISSRFSESNPDECAFCHMKTESLKQVGSFYPYNTYFRSFGPDEKPDFVVSLCDVCYACLEPNESPYFDKELLKSCTVANQCSQMKGYCIDSYQPIFNIGSQSTIFFSSPRASSSEMNELMNPAISFKGWHTHSKHAELVLSFRSSTSITQILLLLEKGVNGNLMIFTDNFIQVRLKEISRCGSQVLYSAIDCDPTHFAHIIIDGDKDLVIKNIQMRGDMKRCIQSQKSRNALNVDYVKPFELNKYDGMFDFTTRTQTFKLSVPQEIKRVTLKASSVQTIYLTLMYEDKVIDWQLLIVPKVEPGTIIRYQLNEIGGVFDEVKVFYIDKLHTVVPLDISFD